MFASTRFPSTSFTSSTTVLSALALAFGVSAPRAAHADLGDAIGVAIVGGAVICLTNPQLCGGSNGGNGGRAGAVDTVGLNRTQAMWVQGGLQNLGFYYGALDGALGAGSRAAIREYQAAIGEPATGALTAKQVNDLVALSPGFVSYPMDDPYLFNADLANDLSRPEVAQLQTALNQRGFYAGGADGAAGGQTRSAIAAYKAREGLPGGPVASRRLLAHIMGWSVPEPAGLSLASMKPQGAQTGTGGTAGRTLGGAVAVAAPQPIVEAPTTLGTMNAADLSFDISGVTLGMSEAEVAEALHAAMGDGLISQSADAAAFGGTDTLSRATQTLQSSWPDVSSEQVVAFYNSARPDLGLVALFRLIRMPDALDQAAFEAQVLPDIIAKYGQAAMVGDGLWIGNASARSTAQADAAKRGECGALQLANVAADAAAADNLWSTGHGVQLEPQSLDSIKADCGQVLSVRYEGSVIRIGLWNSAALSSAVVAPKIKF